MIPIREETFEVEELTTKTYGLELSGNKILGYKDKIKAMEQAIYKMLLTDRYKYIIYSWNYGIEIKDLFGKPIPYCCVELERRIKECLLADLRIAAVHSFYFENPKNGTIVLNFIASTIFGEIEVERRFDFGF